MSQYAVGFLLFCIVIGWLAFSPSAVQPPPPKKVVEGVVVDIAPSAVSPSPSPNYVYTCIDDVSGKVGAIHIAVDGKVYCKPWDQR